MLVLILILILLAILYSTEHGRALLSKILLLPFKIIGYPFRLAGEIIEENMTRKEREKEQELVEKEQELVENFKKSLTSEDIDLIQEKFILRSYFNDIREQISLYKKFKNGEAHKSYLKPEILITAVGNNSLYTIKPEKIDKLRK